MKLLNAITSAAVISTSLVFSNPTNAAGCYPPLAAKIIDQMVKGGGSPQMAYQSAVDDGNINSQGCLLRVKGYMRNYPYVFGNSLKVMGWWKLVGKPEALWLKKSPIT